MEHVLYDGVITNIPAGRLDGGEERHFEFGLCFVAEGRFDLHGEVYTVDDHDEEVLAGKDDLRIWVRDEGEEG